MAPLQTRVGRIIASTIFALALVGLPAVAGADQPAPHSNAPETAERSESGAQESSEPAEQSDRDQSMILGSDYVMGRFILPLVIGIAAAFALALIVVLRTGERESEGDWTPRKQGR